MSGLVGCGTFFLIDSVRVNNAGANNSDKGKFYYNEYESSSVWFRVWLLPGIAGAFGTGGGGGGITVSQNDKIFIDFLCLNVTKICVKTINFHTRWRWRWWWC